MSSPYQQHQRVLRALISIVPFFQPIPIFALEPNEKISASKASEMLKDYHPASQKNALDAIAAGRVDNAEILIPQLLDMLGRPGEVEQQASIVGAIAYLQTKGNNVIPGLLDKAFGADRGEQMDSIRSLARLGPDGVKALVKVLNSDNEFAQEEAAFALTEHSPAHVSVEDKRPVLKELVAALYHVDANANGHLCRGLLNLGDDAVAELANDFGSGEDHRRLMALTCLNTFGVKASKVTPNLVEVLENDNESILMRKWSAAALGVIGRESEVALPTLLRCLSKENPEVQFGCVRGLGSLGPGAQEAVPALISILETHSGAKNLAEAQLPKEAASAIKAVGPGAAEAVPTLRSMLKSKDRWFQERAIGALGAIGPAAASANDDLAQVISGGSEELRDSAAYSLGRINPEPENNEVSIPEKYQEWFDKGRRDGRVAAKRIDTPPSQANARQTVKEKKSPSANSLRVEVFGTNRQRVEGAKATYSVQQDSGPPFRRAVIDAVSDDLGIFQIENVPPDKGTLIVFAQGYEPSMIGGFGGTQRARPEADSWQRPPMTVDLKEVPLTEAKVVDSASRPVIGASVIIDEYRSAPMTNVTLSTDENGIFGFWVGHGFVSGLVAKDGFMTHRFVLDSKSKNKVIVLLPPFRITGSVVDADSGAKIPNFEIKLGYLIEGQAEFFDQHGGGKSLGKFTEGKYEIKFAESVDPFPGLLEHRILGAEAAGYERAVSRNFKENEGDIKIDLKLKKM